MELEVEGFGSLGVSRKLAWSMDPGFRIYGSGVRAWDSRVEV